MHFYPLGALFNAIAVVLAGKGTRLIRRHARPTQPETGIVQTTEYDVYKKSLIPIAFVAQNKF